MCQGMASIAAMKAFYGCYISRYHVRMLAAKAGPTPRASKLIDWFYCDYASRASHSFRLAKRKAPTDNRTPPNPPLHELGRQAAFASRSTTTGTSAAFPMATQNASSENDCVPATPNASSMIESCPDHVSSSVQTAHDSALLTIGYWAKNGYAALQCSIAAHGCFVPLAAVEQPLIEVAGDAAGQVWSWGWTGQSCRSPNGQC